MERLKPSSSSLALGLKAVDSVLPEGGIARSAVHEVTGSSGNGLAAFLAGQVCRLNKPILWCVEDYSQNTVWPWLGRIWSQNESLCDGTLSRKG